MDITWLEMGNSVMHVPPNQLHGQQNFPEAMPANQVIKWKFDEIIHKHLLALKSCDCHIAGFCFLTTISLTMVF